MKNKYLIILATIATIVIVTIFIASYINKKVEYMNGETGETAQSEAEAQAQSEAEARRRIEAEAQARAGITGTKSGADDTCTQNKSSAAELELAYGKSAQDACTRISSEAEKIEAEYGGTANILKNLPIYSLLNPNNYRGGDNVSTDRATNIVRTNLSSCQIDKIVQTIQQSQVINQENIIDSTKCKICSDPSPELIEIFGSEKLVDFCSINNVRQKNEIQLDQIAALNTIITELLKQESSLESQSLATVLQKVSGLMAGNNVSKSEPCNLSTLDGSTRSYFDSRAECVQKFDGAQKNILQYCGKVNDVVQENYIKSLQDCLIGVDSQKTKDTKTSGGSGSEKKVTQETKGVDTWIIIVVIVLCVISSIIVLLSLFQGGKKGLEGAAKISPAAAIVSKAL